jgi:hypothetical protein
MSFPHVFELISYGALGATVLVVIVFRLLWRRGKKLQEP